MGPASGLATAFISPPTPAGSPPGNSWRTWPRAATKAKRLQREPDWSQSYRSLRLPKKRCRQRDSRSRRRPDPARSRRRSGYPASCRRPSAGAEPATKTLPRRGEDQRGAAGAAATEGPTVATEGRSRAASAAVGATGKR
jgi:hypothetical protein